VNRVDSVLQTDISSRHHCRRCRPSSLGQQSYIHIR